MKYPNPRVIEMTQLNNLLRRRGVKIEWRPKLAVWDVFRYCDAIGPSYNPASFAITTPRGRTDDWFEVCCYALSPNLRRAYR